jgi:transposase-like protein
MGRKPRNVSETCRRHSISPNLFYCWKDEAEQGAKAALGGRSAAAVETEKKGFGLPATQEPSRVQSLEQAFGRTHVSGRVLTKYGLERMLFRLSKSKYWDTFILRGALLFEIWTKERYRATRDVDFLANGDSSPDRFIRIFQDISII